jgi:glycine amidinotransferase
MTWSVYQHWDPLKVCVVGRSYPPEFYSWIKIPHVRDLFERIAIETEEDYQCIIKKIQSFGVEVLRPELLVDPWINDRYMIPPMTPRDIMCMIGDKFYHNMPFEFQKFYDQVKDPSWPQCQNLEEFKSLPDWIQTECYDVHQLQKTIDNHFEKTIFPFEKIFAAIASQNNEIVATKEQYASGAMVSRIGRDLYFATERYDVNIAEYKRMINSKFPATRNHVVNTGGHGDGTYCPVCPGLIISLKDVPTYADTFPGWEVVYLPGQSWTAVKPFIKLKEKNRGKWWIPGFEYDQSVIDVVESWLSHWTGYVEETVFDVNMLIIDPKNVMVFNYNKQVFDALERYGITAHVVPFRHRYFWDGGIHCVTADLHREGNMQDYFPLRG